VFDKLRQEWMYWRFRNITRRRQVLRARFRQRQRKPIVPAAFRARGVSDAYVSSYRPTHRARGLWLLAVAAAVLTVVNIALASAGVRAPLPFLLDVVIAGGLAYGYVRTVRY